jgi:hypothetical protein
MTHAILLRYWSQEKGAWKWARTRGHYRVVLIDYQRKFASERCLGYLEEFYRSGECTEDYAGGRWGFERWEAQAEEIAVRKSSELGIPLIRNSSDLAELIDAQEAQ